MQSTVYHGGMTYLADLCMVFICAAGSTVLAGAEKTYSPAVRGLLAPKALYRGIHRHVVRPSLSNVAGLVDMICDITSVCPKPAVVKQISFVDDLGSCSS